VYSVFEQMMNASGSGVKAPEIYRAFECERQTYIVMEYVDGETVGALLRGSSAEKSNWIYDQVAKAITQLLHVPVPSGSHPGPVGGGCIQHYFFRDYVAPKEYDSVGELQRHINKVYY
jgi:serine/threonine protein kinase